MGNFFWGYIEIVSCVAVGASARVDRNGVDTIIDKIAKIASDEGAITCVVSAFVDGMIFQELTKVGVVIFSIGITAMSKVFDGIEHKAEFGAVAGNVGDVISFLAVYTLPTAPPRKAPSVIIGGDV